MNKILYIINVDWFFMSHFLPVGKEAIKRGYEVHLACTFTDRKVELEGIGFIVHEMNISRSGTNVFKEFKTMYQMYKLLKIIQPDIVEFFTIKPVLYGGIISKLLKVPKKVFYITGLGYVFIAKGFKGALVKHIVKCLYKLAISGGTNAVITENIFDKQLIGNLNILAENQVYTIKGAGVDLNQYRYTEEQNQDITIVMASRLLKDKGVFEYISAANILKKKGFDIRFQLYGDIDEGNPATLTVEDIEDIKHKNIVSLYGFSSDIAMTFANANIIVLPSYREGLPKVLIEAAACGRAVVTTDVPGCRDAIEPNRTGLLCRVKDANSLAQTIEQLIINENLRNSMGKAARELAEKEFDIQKVISKHFKVYEGSA